jgi:restriction endonuclease S subunit
MKNEIDELLNTLDKKEKIIAELIDLEAKRDKNNQEIEVLKNKLKDLESTYFYNSLSINT